MSAGRHPAAQAHDAGVTLVEVLVAMTVFAVLGSLLLGLGLLTSRTTDDVRGIATVGEEARLGMERMTRELRQATAVSSVSLPATSHDPTTLTVMVNFDGDDCIATSASDPAAVEEITYEWEPVTNELTMQASGAERPLLATKVTELHLDLNSSAWQYDANNDGTTTWQEIDASSIGDHSPSHFSPAELANIDLIGLTITTEAPGDGQALHYATSVDLRNQDPAKEITTCTAP